jgi:hypothetical protein
MRSDECTGSTGRPVSWQQLRQASQEGESMVAYNVISATKRFQYNLSPY